jgi:pimeloyl-ACP methyl ester carboxylesterase
VAKVILVHGIAQQFKGEELSLKEWAPALRDGIRSAGKRALADALPDHDLASAFYGSVFRPPGRPMSPAGEHYTADDLTDIDYDLLMAWWDEASIRDPQVIGPATRSMVRTPASIRTALRVMSGSRFFAGLSDRLMIGNLVQVRRYFTEPDIRAAARAAVANAVSAETRVIVAHSLGSVIAYEALHANPDWNVRSLVTVGSPLGINKVVFDRLDPAPAKPKTGATGPRGRWPGSVATWTNIADEGDIVALVPDLRPLFGVNICSRYVYNGFHAHDVVSYLTTPDAGHGIAAGLEDAIDDTETRCDD